MTNTPSIFLLRMINGDELIAEVDSNTTKKVYLKNPLIVEENFDPDTGTSSILLSSYAPFGVEGLISLQANHVMSMIPVKPQIERYYQNSLKYNAVIITKRLEEEMESINSQMEDMIMKRENQEFQAETVSPTKSKLRLISGGLVSPSSNTMH